jgi:hypothetical protein
MISSKASAAEAEEEFRAHSLWLSFRASHLDEISNRSEECAVVERSGLGSNGLVMEFSNGPIGKLWFPYQFD